MRNKHKFIIHKKSKKMKKTILSALLIGAVVIGCKKEEVEPQDLTNQDNNPPTETVTLEVEDTPSANAADDNKSSGVYKGTFVGSSGSFKLTLEADNIKGTLVVDGVGYELTSSDVSNSDLGSAISNASFTDENGTVNLTFSVDANGQNPTVSLTITGHSNIEIVVSKETSNNQIKIYEGIQYWDNCDLEANIALNSDNTAKGMYRPDCGESVIMANDYEYSSTGNTIFIDHPIYEDDLNPDSVTSRVEFCGNGWGNWNINDEKMWIIDGSDSIVLYRQL